MRCDYPPKVGKGQGKGPELLREHGLSRQDLQYLSFSIFLGVDSVNVFEFSRRFVMFFCCALRAPGYLCREEILFFLKNWNFAHVSFWRKSPEGGLRAKILKRIQKRINCCISSITAEAILHGILTRLTLILSDGSAKYVRWVFLRQTPVWLALHISIS